MLFKISLGTCFLLFFFYFFFQNEKNKTNGPYYCVTSHLSEGWVLCQAVPFSFRSMTSALLSLLNNIEAKLKFLFASLKCWLWRAWWECGVFTGGQAPHMCCEEAPGVEGAAIVVYFEKYLQEKWENRLAGPKTLNTFILSMPVD